MGNGTDEQQIDIGNNRRTSFLKGLLHDLMLAGRRILRRPGFALIVVITLAVGRDRPQRGDLQCDQSDGS